MPPGDPADLGLNTLHNLTLQQLSSLASQMDKNGAKHDDEEIFAVFLKHLDNYVLPVIILLGIVGNIISFTGGCCTSFLWFSEDR